MFGERLSHTLFLAGTAGSAGADRGGSALASLILPLMGVLCIVFLAYAFTKWLMKRYQGYSAGKYVKVIERVPLSQDKMLVLVEVNRRAYLLGIAGQSIETVCSFDAGELPPKPAPPAAGFQAVFEETLKKNLPFLDRRKKDGDGAEKP